MIKPMCCCSDKGCPECAGQCSKEAVNMLCRVDMSNAFDLPMCEGCTEDALESGVFGYVPLSAGQFEEQGGTNGN